jgi:hypothetical protein
MRESRNVLLKKLDARLRGHDAETSPSAQFFSCKIFNFASKRF